MEIGFAFNSFSSVNNSEGKVSEASYWRPVESEAKQRGCKYAFVDTFSFQAPIFYKKHGYQEVFTLEEYPYTEKRHYYTKKFVLIEINSDNRETYRRVDSKALGENRQLRL